MGTSLAKLINEARLLGYGAGIYYRRKGDLSEGRISRRAVEGILQRKHTEGGLDFPELRAALNLPKAPISARLVRSEDLSSLGPDKVQRIAKMRRAKGPRPETDIAEVLQTAGVNLAAEIDIATILPLSLILIFSPLHATGVNVLIRRTDAETLKRIMNFAGEVGRQEMINAAGGNELLKLAGYFSRRSAAYQTVISRLRGEA